MPFPATVLCAVVLVAGRDELGDRLRELSSPEVRVRHRAERWLGMHVGAADYTVLAREAQQGDAEVRLRIGRVVGAADPDLSLVALFLSENDPQLVEVGERAVRERVARWNPAFTGVATTDAILRDALQRRAERSWPATLRLSIDGTLADACALLERRADLPVGLAVEPALRERERVARFGDELIAPWDELVPELAEAFGVRLDGHGLDPLHEDRGRPAFLRLGEVLSSYPF